MGHRDGSSYLTAAPVWRITTFRGKQARWWFITLFSFVFFNQIDGLLGHILCIIHVFFYHYDGPTRLTFFCIVLVFLTTVLLNWHFLHIHVFLTTVLRDWHFLHDSCFAVNHYDGHFMFFSVFRDCSFMYFFFDGSSETFFCIFCICLICGGEMVVNGG